MNKFSYKCFSSEVEYYLQLDLKAIQFARKERITSFTGKDLKNFFYDFMLTTFLLSKY